MSFFRSHVALTGLISLALAASAAASGQTGPSGAPRKVPPPVRRHDRKWRGSPILCR